MSGKLYLVPTPIGNWEDFTVRALHTLKDVDVIVCEEAKEGRRVLREVDIVKPLEELNEHNAAEATDRILQILADGKDVALISDCGTPVFADPGSELVCGAIRMNITVSALPGPTSIMPALVASGFPIDNFVSAGFLSPKKGIRQKELAAFKKETRTVVIMETPYRLAPLVRDMRSVLGETREAVIALNLTMPDEEFIRGTIAEIDKTVSRRKIKGEFIVVVRGAGRIR